MSGITFLGRRALACLGIACGCALASWNGAASAAQLFYDGFEIGANPGQYVAGPVAGQSGGTAGFFNSPWLQAGGNVGIVRTNSLFYPGQTEPSLGGSLGDDDVTGCCITQRNGRTMTAPWLGRNAPEGTFYIGFLANFGTSGAGPGNPPNGPHHRVLEFWNDAGVMADSARVLQLGYSEFTGVLGPGRTMAMWVKDTTTLAGTMVPLAPGIGWNTDGDTHSVILKIVLSAVANSDSVSVFIDPAQYGEPVTPSASVSGIDWGVDTLGAITQFTFTGAESATRIDEFRVGTTFNDVTIKSPEPASVVMGGLAVLGLISASRRKRS